MIPEITFRSLPDKNGDSCTFLTWFLPTEDMAKATVAEMKTSGVYGGNFYWYDNNWHYIRKWDHLKQSTTLNGIGPLIKDKLVQLANTDFPASDAIMSRCISTLINLSWTEEQVKEKGEKMVAAIKKALEKSSVTSG